MQLKRDAGTGRILNGQDNNRPVILVGGAYYLFKEDGRGDYGLDIDGQPTPVIWYARQGETTSEPCQKNPNTQEATHKFWPSTQLLLTRMREERNNLLRIFLTNSYVASDLFPYNVVGGKLAVQDAVQNGKWNEAYFGRLLAFAQAADSNGVALQLSVFNFFDFDAWEFSPWNPARAHDLTPGWSAQHLVSTGGVTPAQRCAAFMDVTNARLTLVKQAFINKLVNTLRGQGNIIFELMNEPRGPHGTTASYQARFLSQVAGMLIAAFGSWRPLLSVNAFPPSPLDEPDIDTVLDMDAWRAEKTTLPHYAAIDLVSYHGISGMGAKETVCGRSIPVLFPFVDNDSIEQRTRRHFDRFQDKAMIYSTDGAKLFDHLYIGGKMSIRDGQIATSLKDDTTGVPAFNQRHHSDLANWAYWCLRQAFAHPGRCHFQNHSSYNRSIIYIRESYAKAQGSGTDYAPPFTPPAWTTWQLRSIPPNDFNVAVNFNANLGHLVVQLGTVASPADAAQAGEVEVGFLRLFTATSNRARVVANYTPVSVTARSSGATVTPAVALRIHAVDAGGNVGALIARQPVLLRPGAAPGQIELSATVAAGQRYALIIAANVGVQYQNRWQGYGEVIVGYQRAVLTF